ncbi:MAG: N-acetylmuramic acid 6-phosphate etherase [Bacteroidota bacterium]
MISITEQDSLYPNLSDLKTSEILGAINNEDQKVALAIQAVLPAIESLIDTIVDKMKNGGRLFYIGAGTSGRLGILDASECPPTYGVPHGLVIGIIAGGDAAIRKAVEFAEDNTEQAYKDLQEHHIQSGDVVVGISASGKTPYVYGGLKACQKNNITTAAISCNSNALISTVANYPIEVVVGPEIVTGSTRMKAGTAQKLVLNMITTTTMIQLGHVQGSKMVDMQLSNDKLIDRGTRMVMEKTTLSYDEAQALLKKSGNVRKAIDAFNNS